MTVHLVYPSDSPAQTPGAIGWHLRKYLGAHFGDVECYPWDGFHKIRPRPGDILIGHLHPLPGTTMRRSLKEEGWWRRILLNPFCFDVAQVGYLDPWIEHVDALIAICGPEWAQRLPFSYFSHWYPKFVAIDLAIDATLFPFRSLKQAPRRALLYVGHLRWYKNPKYLEALAVCMPDFDLAWMGPGGNLKGWRKLGYAPLSEPRALRQVHSFPASITVGSFDANPTTVLESMALGLLPFATNTSGWSEAQGVRHVPAWSPPEVAEIINDAFSRDLDWWTSKLSENRRRSEQQFSWENFAAKVISTIEEPPVRPFEAARDSRRRIIISGSAVSPMLRRQVVPQGPIRSARRFVRQMPRILGRHVRAADQDSN